MTLLFFAVALVAYMAFAAPATSGQPPTSPAHSLQNNASAASTLASTKQNVSSSITPSPSLNSAPPLNLANVSSSQFPDASNSVSITSTLSPSFSSVLPSSASFATPSLSTIFVTEIATAFQTKTITPTSTDTVTVVVTATATAIVIASPSPSWDDRTSWVPPPQMTDLSAFNVTYFPSGQRNLNIVAQIPAQDIAPTLKPSQAAAFSSANTTTVPTILQLVYPAHSVNPGSKPEGGADFYATPLNLAGARNVTLEYSVFFPDNFNWVKGGKLPGLFGGHTGCSGGASASDCFSTRLMWRPQGIGELYLYAPKDKQTNSLCEDVETVCDASYGFSIGRGAFNFTTGNWTHLHQNVVLNTPGKNDGIFKLSVDGLLAINRSDIFYRDVARPRKNAQGNDAPTEFIGLFFSTFFGGHGQKYATPKQQYTWFKDFTITRHG